MNTKEPFEAKQLSYAYSLKFSQEFDRYNKQIQSNSSNQFHCSSAHKGRNGNGGMEWDDGTTENVLKKRNIETGFENVIAGHEDEARQIKSTSRAPTFRQVWEMYVQERKPSESNLIDNSTHIRRFIELVGDKPITHYNKLDIKKYKDILLKVPASMTNQQRKAGILATIKQLEEAGTEYRKLSPYNIGDRCLSVVRLIFNYAIGNALIQNNPADGITVSYKKSVTPPRLPFSTEEISKILSSPLFTDEDFILSPQKKIDYRWIIILAIFTGARLEEIGRLAVDDIGTENDILYIFIHEDESIGRTVKNAASIRKIPIHSELIRLGFMVLVAEAKTAQRRCLFPSLFKPKLPRGNALTIIQNGSEGIATE